MSEKNKGTKNTAAKKPESIDDTVKAYDAEKAASAPAATPEVVDAVPAASTALAPTGGDGASVPAVTGDPLAGIMRVGDDGLVVVDFDAAEKVGDKVSGGFDGPSWVPFHHPDRTKLNAAALREKLEKLPGGVASGIDRGQIAGNLVVMFAWGRRAYFLDVKREKSPGVMEEIRVKLPEHWSLYSGCNLILLGTPIALRYDGTGKAKDGKQPPHLYSVIALQKGRTLNKPRKDALTIESIDDRKKRIAKEKLREEERKAALDAMDAADDGGEDLPF